MNTFALSIVFLCEIVRGIYSGFNACRAPGAKLVFTCAVRGVMRTEVRAPLQQEGRNTNNRELIALYGGPGTSTTRKPT